MNPILKEGWELQSEFSITPVLQERPPVVMESLLKGNYTQLEILKRAFKVEFYLDGATTSLLQVVINCINTNLERNNHKRKSKNNSKYYLPIEEKQFWMYLGCYMVTRLKRSTEMSATEAAKIDIHEAFLGVNRFKVFFCFSFALLSFLNVSILK